jgi:hypothetical protein
MIRWFRRYRHSQRELPRLLEREFGPDWGQAYLAMSWHERRAWTRRAMAGF